MHVVGIDEAGRGPLAGPVSVGFIYAPEELDILAAFPGTADSKKLSEKKREEIFSHLEKTANEFGIAYRVFFGSAKDIDTRGIAVVIRELIALGLQELVPETASTRVFLDGALRAPEAFTQKTIIGGDATVPVISLASIVAKVSRDRLMRELAEKYPQYGFEVHKGYGTKIHYEKLREYGLSAIHRKTFIHLA